MPTLSNSQRHTAGAKLVPAKAARRRRGGRSCSAAPPADGLFRKNVCHGGRINETGEVTVDTVAEVIGRMSRDVILLSVQLRTFRRMKNETTFIKPDFLLVALAPNEINCNYRF